MITALNEQIKTLEGQVEAHFGQHPDAEIIRPSPAWVPILGARVLAEFGDDPHRYADAKARKNYAGTSPITRDSGKRKPSLARYVHNDRLLDALHRQAFAALTASPGARAYYDQLSAPAAPATTPPCASSPTASSASCTAASRPAPPTTRPPPGDTATAHLSPPPPDPSASHSPPAGRNCPTRRSAARVKDGRRPPAGLP